MSINFVIAMAAEARPIIDYYQLRRQADTNTPFDRYSNEDVQLVVSGMGKVQAAAATGWLANHTPSDSVWINAGVCGHGSQDKGTLLQAVKIVDPAANKVWYPPQILRQTLELTTVYTVDKIEKEYIEPVAYEMEAGGFYPIATRVSTGELCQCLKIVSDTRVHGVAELTLDKVTELMGIHVNAIADIAAQLQRTAMGIVSARTVDLDPWTGRWRFSVTQAHELNRLLHALTTRQLNDQALVVCEALSSSHDVLAKLRHFRQSLPRPQHSQKMRP